MSRVMRRTPYNVVRFNFRKQVDDTYGYVAVVPCKRCSAWKTMACDKCSAASPDHIRKHIKEPLAFIHNMDEDRWVQKKWCDEQHEYILEE